MLEKTKTLLEIEEEKIQEVAEEESTLTEN